MKCLLVCLLLPAMAWATTQPDPDPGQSQDQYQNQLQNQNQSQYQIQDQVTEVSVVNEVTIPNGALWDGSPATAFSEGAIQSFGGDTNVNVVTENPDELKIKNTPDARAPYSNSTSPCIVGFSAGVGVPGFGGSLGRGFEDEECTRRQSAQTWSNMGMPAVGLWLMCRSEDMARTGKTPEECDAMVAALQKDTCDERIERCEAEVYK